MTGRMNESSTVERDEYGKRKRRREEVRCLGLRNCGRDSGEVVRG